MFYAHFAHYNPSNILSYLDHQQSIHTTVIECNYRSVLSCIMARVFLVHHLPLLRGSNLIGQNVIVFYVHSVLVLLLHMLGYSMHFNSLN